MTDTAPRWWDAAAAASHCGINPGTWRDYVSSGFAPAPDDPDERDPDGRPIPRNRRRPRWKPDTVTTWHAGRPRPRNSTTAGPITT